MFFVLSALSAPESHQNFFKTKTLVSLCMAVLKMFMVNRHQQQNICAIISVKGLTYFMWNAMAIN